MIATRTTPHINRAKKKSLLAGYKFKVHGINFVRVGAIRGNQPVDALYKLYVKLRGGEFYWKMCARFALITCYWNTKCETVMISGLRACLHGGGAFQVGEVKYGGSPHLSCKRDQIRRRDYMDKRVTPPKRVTSPTWGPPPPCKQVWNKSRSQNGAMKASGTTPIEYFGWKFDFFIQHTTCLKLDIINKPKQLKID